MANVLLTTKCNLNCAYCFAQERRQDNGDQVMSLSAVCQVIEFLNRSQHPIFRAMGGEPTLHPQFPNIVQMALEHGMRVDVLSNATWPESYNALFARISPRRLFFLLNIDHPSSYRPNIWEHIQRNLAAVAAHGNVTLSFNIFEPEPRSDYILDLIRAHGVNKLRMSFSMPVLGTHNQYLTLEQQKRVAPFVVDFVRRVKALGVEIKLDNVFPPCFFNHEQLGELLVEGVVDLNRNMRCDPIIDIGPDLGVWCCFCLSKLWRRRLDEFQNLQEIIDYYRRAMGLYQGRLYPLEECDHCRYRELWGCQGGCLTHTVMKHGELSLERQPAASLCCDWQPEALLTLSPDVAIRHYDMPVDSWAVYNRATGMEMEVGASLAPLLQLLNGQHSARDVVDDFVRNGAQPPSDGPLMAFADQALKQAAQELLLNLQQRGFVVALPNDAAAGDAQRPRTPAVGSECVTRTAVRT